MNRRSRVFTSGLRRRVLRSMGRRGVFRSELMNRRSRVFTSGLLDRRRRVLRSGLWADAVRSGALRAAFWTDLAVCLGATFRTDVCWQSLNLQNARACTGEATTPTNSPRQQATNIARMAKTPSCFGNGGVQPTYVGKNKAWRCPDCHHRSEVSTTFTFVARF